MIFFVNQHYMDHQSAKHKKQEEHYKRYMQRIKIKASPTLRKILVYGDYFHDVFFLAFDYQKERKILAVDALVWDQTLDRYRRMHFHFTRFQDDDSFYPKFNKNYYVEIYGGYYNSGEFHYNEFLQKYEYYFQNNISTGNTLIAYGKRQIFHQEYKLVFSDIRIVSQEIISCDTIQSILKKRKPKFVKVFDDN